MAGPISYGNGQNGYLPLNLRRGTTHGGSKTAGSEGSEGSESNGGNGPGISVKSKSGGSHGSEGGWTG
jgi:hypothetical protein